MLVLTFDINSDCDHATSIQTTNISVLLVKSVPFWEPPLNTISATLRLYAFITIFKLSTLFIFQGGKVSPHFTHLFGRFLIHSHFVYVPRFPHIAALRLFIMTRTPPTSPTRYTCILVTFVELAQMPTCLWSFLGRMDRLASLDCRLLLSALNATAWMNSRYGKISSLVCVIS